MEAFFSHSGDGHVRDSTYDPHDRTAEGGPNVSLVDEEGKPDTDIQLLVQMAEPGEWHITVLDEDAVDSSWYDGNGTPDTGMTVGSSGGTQ